MDYLNIDQFAADLVKFADGHAAKSGYRFDDPCLEHLGVKIVDGVVKYYPRDDHTYNQWIDRAKPNLAKLVAEMYPYSLQKVLYVASLDKAWANVHDLFCPGFFPFC